MRIQLTAEQNRPVYILQMPRKKKKKTDKERFRKPIHIRCTILQLFDFTFRIQKEKKKNKSFFFFCRSQQTIIIRNVQHYIISIFYYKIYIAIRLSRRTECISLAIRRNEYNIIAYRYGICFFFSFFFSPILFSAGFLSVEHSKRSRDNKQSGRKRENPEEPRHLRYENEFSTSSTAILYY